VPAIDENEHAQENRAAAQISSQELGPARDLLLADGGIAPARHVDEPQLPVQLEEIEFLRPPRRARHARQRLAPGQCIDQRRLAHIGAAGNGDFR
jgi:hypothetical protein